MKKTIYLLSFFLFSFAAAYGQKEPVVTEEYSIYFKVPENSKFRAKNSYDITISGEFRLNNDKIKWELFYNSVEQKPRAIDFICSQSISIEQLNKRIQATMDENFWESVTKCLAGDILETFDCMNELIIFK